MAMATSPSWSDLERWIEEGIQRLHRHTKICEELMSEDLPKQELLKKLLKMTTSENDGECVVAIRKANALLKVAGWDWDRLLDGKIKVIEDPFKTVADPFTYQDWDRSRPTPRPPAKPAPAPPPPPPRAAPQPAPRPAKPRGNPIASTKANLYAGWCYCCGNPVQGQQGFIFDPSTKNHSAKSKWQIICKACNVLDFPVIATTNYPRQKPLSAGGPAPSLSDI